MSAFGFSTLPLSRRASVSGREDVWFAAELLELPFKLAKILKYQKNPRLCHRASPSL